MSQENLNSYSPEVEASDKKVASFSTSDSGEIIELKSGNKETDTTFDKPLKNREINELIKYGSPIFARPGPRRNGNFRRRKNEEAELRYCQMIKEAAESVQKINTDYLNSLTLEQKEQQMVKELVTDGVFQFINAIKTMNLQNSRGEIETVVGMPITTVEHQRQICEKIETYLLDEKFYLLKKDEVNILRSYFERHSLPKKMEII